MYEEVFQTGSLPPSLNDALISLIPKKGRDHTDPANFRPISLINVDSKILAKVLALRLEMVLSYIKHTDQVGFIKGRSSTRKAFTFNVVELFQYSTSGCCLIGC